MKPLEPSVEILNHIQAEWMKLDIDAPEKEKARVLALMKHYPKCYLSANAAKTLANVQCSGAPITAGPIPMHHAIEICKRYNGRVDVVWLGNHWETL